jgi:hypothetical protein
MYYLLAGAAIGTIAFSVYIATSSGTKGVVTRPDAEGDERFVPFNLGRWMVAPLHDKNFWKKPLLGANYIIWLCGSVSVTALGKFCLDNLNTGE